MSERLLKNTKFRSEIRKFYNLSKGAILDIILFGSALKGKDNPKDIDLLILFKDNKDFDLSYKLKKILEKHGCNAEIKESAYGDFMISPSKAKDSIISEGYSLVYNQFLAKGFGFDNFILFKYELKGMNKSQRMRFYYGLYGRTKQQSGILKKLKAIKFSESIFLCPVENAEQMKDFFSSWKMKFREFPIMIPLRIENLFKK